VSRSRKASADLGTAGHRLVLQPDRVRELSLLAIIVVALLAFSLFFENALSGSFFNRVTTSVAITAVLAAGQTVVIITRNIDLSVGSIVGVTAYLTGEYLGDHPDAGLFLAIAIAMLIGAGLGLLNGSLVAYGRVPAIVVTLGTLAIFRTWLLEHANSQNITADTLPPWLDELPRRSVLSIGEFDIRLTFAVAVLVVLLLQAALGRLRWGRWLYAIGSNPEAARQAGIPAQPMTLVAFVVSGSLAGLAGFMFLERFGTITVFAGTGLELASVAAAVVGGVSVLGGSGTVLGAMLGAVLIALLDQSLLRVPQVSEFWRDAILGILILAGVTADLVLGRRLRRRWAESRRPLSLEGAAQGGSDA
jgi:rhamnose transport system permease protein